MLDQAAVIKTVERYAEAVAKEMRPQAILLYGSYAKGTAREDSDIDVAVVFDGYHGQWLADSAKLWQLTVPISLDIEPVLVDSSKDPSGFVADIFRTGQVIYRA